MSAPSKGAQAGARRDPYLVELGQRIRELREGRKMTQQQCAEASGLGADVISRLENGRYSSPGLRSLRRVAFGLRVRLADLLPDTPLPIRHSNPTQERVRLQIAEANPRQLELIEELVGAVLRTRD